ncbi:MAG: hypothetical protein H7Y13_03795 [Sphingobacteriaceae bacterium]|nr:hypothetical protein [Sphingobacteriaceae bacterium]
MSPEVSREIDPLFMARTVEMLNKLRTDIQALIDSGDLDISLLATNNIIRYNTFHENLQSIELFRYLVIVNYGRPEEYFKKKVNRIYNEINCLQRQPIITTISNSNDYYWALPSYDIIAVPAGEERNLLNLPDLFHEMGHLIYNQYEIYLKGSIEETIAKFYEEEYQRIIYEQRAAKLIEFYRDKHASWHTSWIMEFVCDLIATYLVGPAFAWTNLKLTTLSSAKSKIYLDSKSHPSDEARMRAIFTMLKKMGHGSELIHLEESWKEFLEVTKNPVPSNYQFIFPPEIIEQLVDSVFEGCYLIGLKVYNEQKELFENPISKILNDSWDYMFSNPKSYESWEKAKIKEIEDSL